MTPSSSSPRRLLPIALTLAAAFLLAGCVEDFWFVSHLGGAGDLQQDSLDQLLYGPSTPTGTVIIIRGS